MDKHYYKRTRGTWRRPRNGNTHRLTQNNTKKNIKRIQMNRYQQSAQVPDWMTKGKTTLFQKDPNKGTTPNNCRPITCLPMIWKILTAQVREKIYYSLTSRRLFPDEQKGCRKGFRGTAELLYIDQHILNESKTWQNNLAMAWIDYKKAYDMVPQSWIIHRLKMYKIAHEF